MTDSRAKPIEDHPDRYDLANEIHARPFPVVSAPCHAVYVALKPVENAAARDRSLERTHLQALLHRFGVATEPKPSATHFFGDFGRHRFKWESHTEFVTYTVFADGVADRPFDPAAFDVLPVDWLAASPAPRITSALIRVEPWDGDDNMITEKLGQWFVSESVAVSRVLDGAAVIAGDFRIDAGGHMRFAIFVRPGTGDRRVGRIVQRLCEIETYKTMSMLGFRRARGLSPQMGAVDAELNDLTDDMTGPTHAPEAVLERLLRVAGELEGMRAKNAFRFGATAAYEAIVSDRIEALRETSFGGRQSFQEFMRRRFDPAMRTVKSTEARLAALAERATRAGNLLRTRVDVERQAQNQSLLESMDRRADLQLRLQRTVEGLSVVAISYYAVNLVAYMVYPMVEPLGLTKGLATAVLTPLVVLAVWLMIRRIHHQMD